MAPADEYMEAAQAYADGVRVLFAPSGAPTGERGGRGPASPKDLADQVDRLSPLSAQLTRAAAAQLADADPEARIRASTRLLAKALTDLDVSAYVLLAAEDEEEKIPWAGGKRTERSRAGLGATEKRLRLLLGEVEPGLEKVERGERPPADLPAARAELSTSVEDALKLIPKRAGKTGQVALDGLLPLGVAEVAGAAGAIGMGIAQAMGQAEKVTRLYNLFRDFAIRAFDALAELVGSKLIKGVAERVVDWVKDLKEGGVFSELLEKLYETEQTNRHLSQVVDTSEADLAKFVAAIEGVDGLEAAYRRQVDLVEKLLKGLKFIAFVPATVLPQSALLLAAVNIILGGYVVLAGADYVDARRLRLLDRVPGVRTLVEAKLLTT